MRTAMTLVAIQMNSMEILRVWRSLPLVRIRVRVSRVWMSRYGGKLLSAGSGGP